MSKKNRIKTSAVEACISAIDVDQHILAIGREQRERERLATAMNEEIAAVKARYEEAAVLHGAAITSLAESVRIYCEANRAELTKDGRTKTYKFGAGEVSWRMRPPRVNVRGEENVLQALHRLGLEQFIRTTEAIDKQAILADPKAVQDVKGLTIAQGEDFVIKPIATELEEVAP